MSPHTIKAITGPAVLLYSRAVTQVVSDSFSHFIKHDCKQDLHSTTHPWPLSGSVTTSAAGVSDVARGGLLRRCSTHLAVFLVLAPHLFAEASGRLAGSVWRDDVVVDQSRQVSPHGGQVSTVGQPWRHTQPRSSQMILYCRRLQICPASFNSRTKFAVRTLHKKNLSEIVVAKLLSNKQTNVRKNITALAEILSSNQVFVPSMKAINYSLSQNK